MLFTTALVAASAAALAQASPVKRDSSLNIAPNGPTLPGTGYPCLNGYQRNIHNYKDATSGQGAAALASAASQQGITYLTYHYVYGSYAGDETPIQQCIYYCNNDPNGCQAFNIYRESTASQKYQYKCSLYTAKLPTSVFQNFGQGSMTIQSSDAFYKTSSCPTTAPACDSNGYQQDLAATFNAATSGPGYLTYHAITNTTDETLAYQYCENYCSTDSSNRCVYGNLFSDNTATSPSAGGYTCSIWSQYQSPNYYTNQLGSTDAQGNPLITNSLGFSKCASAPAAVSSP